jgi:hypothetical protein
VIVVTAIALLASSSMEADAARDAAFREAFAAFGSDLPLTKKDLERLRAGEPVAQKRRDPEGGLVVSAILKTHATPEALELWTSDIEKQRHPRYMPEAARFSSPPSGTDLASLTVEAGDLKDLADCRVTDCALKLSASEIERVRDTRVGTERATLLREFLLDRANSYFRCGMSCVASYASRPTEVRPQDVLAALLARTPVLTHLPDAATASSFGGTTPISFLYWSKQRLGRKPVVAIAHQYHVRPPASAVELAVVSKQVYATHYFDGAITIKALVATPEGKYLVYLHRSDVDALRGALGGIVRRVVERRVTSEAPALLRDLRERLESGTSPVRSNLSAR